MPMHTDYELVCLYIYYVMRLYVCGVEMLSNIANEEEEA